MSAPVIGGCSVDDCSDVDVEVLGLGCPKEGCRVVLSLTDAVNLLLLSATGCRAGASAGKAGAGVPG